VYWLKVIYRFANTDGITNSKDIASIEDKQSYLLTDILRKIRLVISKYADDNKKKFESKKIKGVTLHGAQSTYRYLYENELKFKMSIKACDDLQKFERLLSVCLMYKNEFRHNNYGKKHQALKNPAE
ncbi:MAG: hypothetical protein KBS95_03130, partial [Alistipes sp.]|nr:hypothetical protein [Candidatus Alistipes equi]